jgi:hypothetical protein
MDGEQDIRESDLAILTGEQEAEDDDSSAQRQQFNRLKFYPFENNAFYITCLRSDPIDYPGVKLDRFKQLAKELKMYLIIVRKGGAHKVDMLEENGILEFKATINNKMLDALPSEEYKRKSSCQAITGARDDLFSHWKSIIFRKLHSQLVKNKQFVHPLFDLRIKITDYANKAVPQTSSTKLIAQLKAQAFLHYFDKSEWSSEQAEIDMTPELEAAEKSFKEYYPAFLTLLKADGGYGDEEYCPMKYQYLVDYTNIYNQKGAIAQPDVVVTPY